MAISKKLDLAGAVAIGAGSGCGCTESSDVLPLSHSQTTTGDFKTSRSINSPSTFVDLLAGTGILAVSFLAMIIKNPTSLELRVTTAAGTDQVFRVSSLFVYASAVSGQQVTALAVKGVADIEYQVCGNT